MSKRYDVRPSELLSIPDEYTSYCFDEACLKILVNLENKKEPIFAKSQEENAVVQHYSRVSEFYNNILNKR